MKQVAVIILSFLMFTACENSQNAYKIAKEQNTIEAYTEFAKQFSNSEYADSAMQKVYLIEFKNICFINNIESFEQFIIKYPSSNYTDSAKSKIYKISYENAKKEHSIKSYNIFLSKYPENPYKNEIDSILKILEYTTSDAGIKTNVISTLKKGISEDLKFCINREPKIVTVNNGHVTVKMNCIKVAGCKEINNRSRYMRYYRQTQQWFSSRKSVIQALPGVKSVNLVDMGS